MPLCLKYGHGIAFKFSLKNAALYVILFVTWD